MVDVVVAADEICAVLESRPHVTAADLPAKVLSADEVRYIAQVVPELPKMLESMTDASSTPPAAAPAGQMRSPVAAPQQSVLTGTIKEVDIPAFWVRQGSETAVRVVAMSGDGVAFVAPDKPKQGYLTKLKLDLPGGMLEVFVSPAVIAAAAKGHRIEAKLFAMSGEIKVQWDRLAARS